MKLTLSALVLGLLILSDRPILAQSLSPDEIPKFDVGMLQAALNQLKVDGRFPEVPGEGQNYCPASKTQIPDLVEKRFSAISEFIFSENNPFSLRNCNLTEASMDARNWKITINPDYFSSIMASPLYKNADAVVDFILAHELSHYLLELYAKKSPSNRTPHGFAPQVGPDSFQAFVGKNADALSNMDQAQVQAFLKPELKKALTKHAEVDGMAIVILREMGYQDFREILTYLSSMPDQARMKSAEYLLTRP